MQISVLISTYNSQNYIKLAIESVLSQTFTDFELIIINDGSSDNTEEIIHSFNDPRIIYLKQSNLGVSKSLNKGLKIARGKYIAKLDADDICYPFRLEKQYDFMENNPSYVVCGSYTEVIDENDEYIYTFKNVPIENEEIQKQFSTKNCIIHSSSFYRRDIALEIGGYYEPIKQYFEDFMFFFNLIKKGKAFNFSQPLIKYRITPGSISSRTKNLKYDKLVLDVIHRGFILEEEKLFLFNYRTKMSKKNIQLSNHYLALSRLILLHQKNFSKAFLYYSKSLSINLFNHNNILTIFHMLYYYFLNKRQDDNT